MEDNKENIEKIDSNEKKVLNKGAVILIILRLIISIALIFVGIILINNSMKMPVIDLNFSEPEGKIKIYDWGYFISGSIIVLSFVTFFVDNMFIIINKNYSRKNL